MMTARRAGATSATTLCGLALTIVLAQVIAPEWTRRSGLDLWNLPSAFAQQQDCAQEEAALAVESDRLVQQIELGGHVCTQLAAGTRSLRSAVDEMEPIMRQRPGFEAVVELHFRISFRQGVARYLIARVARIVGDDPVERAAVLTRLERECAQLKLN